LHEGNAADSADVPQLRQVADLETGFENEEKYFAMHGQRYLSVSLSASSLLARMVLRVGALEKSDKPLLGIRRNSFSLYKSFCDYPYKLMITLKG
jgi:hypothetical protein